MDTLYVLEGDYELVSLDVACIQSILYAKLSKVPLEIKALDNIKLCALYTAPTLQTRDNTVTNFANIMLQWRNLHGNPDHELSAKEISESLALNNLVVTQLGQVLKFMYWGDQRNSEEFINLWYMKVLPFPFNYSYTKRQKNEVQQLIEVLYPLDTDLDVIKEFVAQTASQCLSTLSVRLGKSKYFYGDTPKCLDVAVYAHVAPLVKLPFPANDIPSLLAMWPNLSEFVKRIDEKYFPDIKSEVKYLKKVETNRQNDDEVSYVAIVILVASATSLAFAFAVKRGLINIDFH